MTSATKLAESVADNASTVADNMFIYMSAAQGSQERTDSLNATAAQIERLNEAWFRLTLQHRMESFDARVNEIEQKEQPK